MLFKALGKIWKTHMLISLKTFYLIIVQWYSTLLTCYYQRYEMRYDWLYYPSGHFSDQCFWLACRISKGFCYAKLKIEIKLIKISKFHQKQTEGSSMDKKNRKQLGKRKINFRIQLYKKMHRKDIWIIRTPLKSNYFIFLFLFLFFVLKLSFCLKFWLHFFAYW